MIRRILLTSALIFGLGACATLDATPVTAPSAEVLDQAVMEERWSPDIEAFYTFKLIFDFLEQRKLAHEFRQSTDSEKETASAAQLAAFIVFTSNIYAQLSPDQQELVNQMTDDLMRQIEARRKSTGVNQTSGTSD